MAAPSQIFTTNDGIEGILQLIKAGVVTPIPQQSAAMSTTTRINSEYARVQIPIVRGDAGTSWTPEGSVIGESAPEIDTVEAIPRGLKGIVPLSNEAIKSGNGDLAGLAINSLSRDLANQIDKAFYANTTTNGPKGLGSIAATTVSPTAFDNLDVFTEAKVTADGLGSVITSWHVNPVDFLKIAKLKETSGSNRGLLEPDPQRTNTAVAGQTFSGFSISGAPLHVSRYVTAGVVWGVPAATTFTVSSASPELVASEDAGFSRDVTMVRATMGVDFAFSDPEGVVKIVLPTT